MPLSESPGTPYTRFTPTESSVSTIMSAIFAVAMRASFMRKFELGRASSMGMVPCGNWDGHHSKFWDDWRNAHSLRVAAGD
jgi:hypothetical protein